MKLDLNDPSPHCDCRSKSIRNARIIAILIALSAFIVASAALTGGTVAYGVTRLAAGLALFVYGIVTIADDTATFPRTLYAGIALIGVAVTCFAVSGLLA